MAQKATLTIRQTEDDLDFKSMVKQLQKKNSPDNPYHRRSESEILKMILEQALPQTYRNVCGRDVA